MKLPQLHLRVLFWLVALVAIGCGQQTESLHVELGGQPEEWLSNGLDADGNATVSNEVELSITAEKFDRLSVRSKPTFFTVAKGKVTRVVYTPMREAGDLKRATESLRSLLDWFPEEQRQEASAWIEKVLREGDQETDEFAQFSNGFDLPNDVEVYVELRRLPTSGDWYSSVHLYQNYGRSE